MRITPLDIRKQEFRKTMRGLDSDEVYAFLSTVAEEYEAVLSDNKNLRERIVSMEESLQEYKNIESNLRNTLLTAEQVTKEARENARKEAGLIVREAEVEAEKAAETIRAHTQQLRREILELKKQKDNYLTRLKTLIESHQKVLGGFEEDFAEVDREIERVGKKIEEDVEKGVPPTRISREKITEEYAHGPRDKVTWGEERKREEEPRPSMPIPEWEQKEHPRDDGAPRENIDSESLFGGADEASAAGAGQTTMPHVDTRPIGADVTPDRTPRDPFGPKGDAPDSAIPEQENAWLDETVRESIAHGIEEKLYPEVRLAGKGDVPTPPPGQESTTAGQHGPIPPPQHGAPDQREPSERGAATAETPTSEADSRQQDHWKEYEVQERKPDWSTYEISSEKRQAAERPSSNDMELDEALSGLREAPAAPGPPAGKPAAQRPAPPPKDGRPEPRKQQPPPWRPAVEPTHPRRPEPDKKQDTITDETSKESGTEEEKDSTWSMEELRRNLTNISKPEERQ